MAKFRLEITNTGERDLRQIEPKLKLKLLKKIKILEDSPFPTSTTKSTVRKIKASRKIPLFRLRFSSYRAIYYIRENTVYILAVVHRKDFDEAIKNIVKSI
ncbi:MAG: type II toxin-antitoxin system RelE/ParE family toxin [Candidatus Aerophobetes bacterium]|nr:type II toxin-antitoxin system RelE/ParE family toxin [Candidatus Aerophobetes bacterium]